VKASEKREKRQTGLTSDVLSDLDSGTLKFYLEVLTEKT
jgi:hypothetical protein